jgi:hypothetical protein
MWSGGVEANGLWFLESSPSRSEAAWIDDWASLAQRYAQRPWVVAYDLRNEVLRPSQSRSQKAGWDLTQSLNSVP